ncbi:MarR family winged helix-turn-helix transcriptional regulator [Massilia cavernae]|nr:MarR family winged helix-turn-helix transcriptional regulator [Massilia cavernae]
MPADKADPSGAVSPADVFEAIHGIMHAHRSQLFRTSRDGGLELAHMEHKVLGFFARHPGATQTDLGVHSGRDKAQLARLVRSLRDKGLLDARADDADRRSTRLFLTPAGQAAHDAMRLQGNDLADRAFAGLSGEECKALAALLSRVRANLDAATGGG